jgi:hypothetical protein
MPLDRYQRMTDRLLNPLEQAVLDLIVSRDVEGYPALRQQLAAVEVVSRKLTGVGFFTDLTVPCGSPRAPTTVGNPVGQRTC